MLCASLTRLFHSLPKSPFKTGFEASLSEALVGKAGGDSECFEGDDFGKDNGNAFAATVHGAELLRAQRRVCDGLAA